MANWEIKKGYLWKLYGEWEKHLDRGILSQCQNEETHLSFWQDSESEFGSYILMNDPDEEPEIDWGAAERVKTKDYQELSILDSRPLLDCDESGVAAYILDIDSDNEVTVALRY
jgi:hypothetical protein